MTRLQVAAQILAGMCAGDWKFEIPEGSTWDDVAIARAFELADKMLRESKTALELEADKYHD